MKTKTGRYPTLIVNRKIQKKTIKHNFPSITEKNSKLENIVFGEDVEKQVHSCTTSQNIN